MQTTDFSIYDEGSVVVITPLNDDARDWIEENVQSEGWQWLGHGLCVDHRMAGPLVDGIASAGFTFGGGH